MLHLPLQQLLYLDPSIQLSLDALHTATLTVKFSTMHIYRRQIDYPFNLALKIYILLHQLLYLDPFSRLGIDALHTTTPTVRSSTTHIYIEGRWTTSQASIDALHTATPTVISRPFHSIDHRCFAYCYTNCYI